MGTLNREYIEARIAEEQSRMQVNRERMSTDNYGLVKRAEEYALSEYKQKLWNKVLNGIDRGAEPIEAVAYTFNEILTNIFGYGGYAGDYQEQAYREWMREWFVQYAIKTESGDSVNFINIEKAYINYLNKQEKAEARAVAKAKREREKTHGYEVNSQGKRVTWQGVRSALKRGGWTVNKHNDVGAQTTIVTGGAWDDPSVTIRHAIKKSVAYTTEELLAKGYWVDSETRDWRRSTYWDRKNGVSLQSWEMHYNVDDEDKIATQEEHVRQVKKTLEDAGYVVHEHEEHQGTHKSTRLQVTGWKVGA